MRQIKQQWRPPHTTHTHRRHITCHKRGEKECLDSGNSVHSTCSEQKSISFLIKFHSYVLVLVFPRICHTKKCIKSVCVRKFFIGTGVITKKYETIGEFYPPGSCQVEGCSSLSFRLKKRSGETKISSQKKILWWNNLIPIDFGSSLYLFYFESKT